jgi:protease I
MKESSILFFVENYYEDLELHYPKYRLQEAGAKVTIAGPKAGEIYKGKNGYPQQADISFDQVRPIDYQALVIPGGYAPDHLRTNSKALEIIQHFHKNQKLIAFICHAGWLPISAGVIKGVKCTSYRAIKDDMTNAGAQWVDEPVVVDGHFISSRSPQDLPFFCPAIIKFLENAKQPARVD